MRTWQLADVTRTIVPRAKGNPSHPTPRAFPTAPGQGEGEEVTGKRASAWSWHSAKPSSIPSTHTLVSSPCPLPMLPAFPSPSPLPQQQHILVSKQHINCFLAIFQMISQKRAAQFERMERRKEEQAGNPRQSQG